MALRLVDLGRSFGKKVLFEQVTVETPATGLIALVGANGAGKTTLLKILATLVRPSRGDAFLCNSSVTHQARRARSHLAAALSAEGGFFRRLTGRENLEFYRKLLGIPQKSFFLEELVQLLTLEEALATPFGQCSSGMKQKLNLARAILQPANLLMLDEPTKALDPATAALFPTYLQTLAQKRLILFATHRLEETKGAQFLWRLDQQRLEACC